MPPHPTQVRASDRRLFALAALVFGGLVLVGFGRTYYFRALVDGPPVRSTLVHVHGALMTLWVVLFVVQTLLIRTNRKSVHMMLGAWGVVLAVALSASGFFTAAEAGRHGFLAGPPNVPSQVFMINPLTDLVMFAGLFGSAVYLRRRPADHKRLMLLTVFNFLPPALARLPVEGLRALGPIVFFGIPAALTIAAVVYDRVNTGTFNRVFLAGSVALILSFPARLIIGGTAAWQGFAGWLLSWAA